MVSIDTAKWHDPSPGQMHTALQRCAQMPSGQSMCAAVCCCLRPLQVEVVPAARPTCRMPHAHRHQCHPRQCLPRTPPRTTAS